MFSGPNLATNLCKVNCAFSPLLTSRIAPRLRALAAKHTDGPSKLARYYFNRRVIAPRMRASLLHFLSPLRAG